jgi:hypothetical protein
MESKKMEYLKKSRTCDRCGSTFKEISNICDFKCGYHWGDWDGKKWTCCQDNNKIQIKNPCIRHDHYDKETKFNSYPNLEINSEDKELVKLLSKKIDFLMSKKTDVVKTIGSKIVLERTY